MNMALLGALLLIPVIILLIIGVALFLPVLLGIALVVLLAYAMFQLLRWFFTRERKEKPKRTEEGGIRTAARSAVERIRQSRRAILDSRPVRSVRERTAQTRKVIADRGTSLKARTQRSIKIICDEGPKRFRETVQNARFSKPSGKKVAKRFREVIDKGKVRVERVRERFTRRVSDRSDREQRSEDQERDARKKNVGDRRDKRYAEEKESRGRRAGIEDASRDSRSESENGRNPKRSASSNTQDQDASASTSTDHKRMKGDRQEHRSSLMFFLSRRKRNAGGGDEDMQYALSSDAQNSRAGRRGGTEQPNPNDVRAGRGSDVAPMNTKETALADRTHGRSLRQRIVRWRSILMKKPMNNASAEMSSDCRDPKDRSPFRQSMRKSNRSERFSERDPLQNMRKIGWKTRKNLGDVYDKRSSR
jgi:hypothetical protein